MCRVLRQAVRQKPQLNTQHAHVIQKGSAPMSHLMTQVLLHLLHDLIKCSSLDFDWPDLAAAGRTRTAPARNFARFGVSCLTESHHARHRDEPGGCGTSTGFFMLLANYAVLWHHSFDSSRVHTVNSFAFPKVSCTSKYAAH